MSTKKNKHAKNAKKAGVLALIHKQETKGDAKNSAIETVKDLVIGVVGGGLAGAAFGKPSLLLGLGTSLMGHYLGSSATTSFGMGMMASGGYQITSNAVSGTKGLGTIEAAKERIKTFGQNLKQRFYLDKIIKKKTAEKESGTNGLGNVQHFKYPSEEKELDLGALDNIEDQIALEAEKMQQRQMSGANDDSNDSGEEKIY
jgi:hypothetical protein